MWTAAKPTLLTTGGEIWMSSTPHGKQGYFWECFQNKNNRFKVFHISSEEVIHKREISEVWTELRREASIRILEEEKADMSELVYAQEYLGLFLDDLRQMFSDQLIDRICKGKRPEVRTKDCFLGCDIARMGRDQGTYEIIHRRDKDRLIHVENIVTEKQLTTATYDKIVELEAIWNFRKIGIDAGSGSLGVGILDFLLREPTTKRKVIALNNLQRSLDHLGERKRGLLKEDMYLLLLALMEKGHITLLEDTNLRHSLKSVQMEYVIKEGQPTKIRIFGKNAHIVEGIVRAVWLANQKHLNSFVSWC
jgi:hypothetical protein